MVDGPGHELLGTTFFLGVAFGRRLPKVFRKILPRFDRRSPLPKIVPPRFETRRSFED